jgi:hypothetical protein
VSLYEHIPHPHVARRAEQGPVKVADQHPAASRVQRVNKFLAIWITRVVGTMWAFYTFNLLASASAKAAFSSGSMTTIVNWVSSNWIQLILLPAILVGQNLQAAASDARSEQTYHDASATLHEASQIQKHLEAQDAHLIAQDDKITAMAAQISDVVTHLTTPGT